MDQGTFKYQSANERAQTEQMRKLVRRSERNPLSDADKGILKEWVEGYVLNQPSLQKDDLATIAWWVAQILLPRQVRSNGIVVETSDPATGEWTESSRWSDVQKFGLCLWLETNAVLHGKSHNWSEFEEHAVKRWLEEVVLVGPEWTDDERWAIRRWFNNPESVYQQSDKRAIYRLVDEVVLLTPGCAWRGVEKEAVYHWFLRPEDASCLSGLLRMSAKHIGYPGTPQDAEDALGEFFAKIFPASIDLYDPERAAVGSRGFRTYLVRSLLRLCWQRGGILRERKRKESRIVAPGEFGDAHAVLETQIGSDDATPEDLAEASEFVDALNDALSHLREDHRRVFEFRWFDGMSYEEIAGAIGRPLGTVKGWLHRAEQVLAQQLKEWR